MRLRSILLAFSMFSIVPVPQVEWEKSSLRDILCAFPFIGIVIGLVLRLWLLICTKLQFGSGLFAAGITLLPLLVSGGIHMDGLCDVADALASHAPAEKKRAILKDSHVGAFAVITVAAYLLTYYALATELPETTTVIWTLALIHCTSRTLSGLLAIIYPKGSGEGLLYAFRSSSDRLRSVGILTVILLLLLGGFFWKLSFPGLIIPACAILWCCGMWQIAKRQFGAMSGDLSGFFLQIAEILMVACYLVLQRVG